jgi:hypothetical protein
VTYDPMSRPPFLRRRSARLPHSSLFTCVATE